MTDDEKRKLVEATICNDLRVMGIVLHDDAGNRIKPGSGEEARVIRVIARSILSGLVSVSGCQTPVAGSTES